MTGSYIIKHIPITILVKVTQQHIKQGMHSCRFCPAALATNEALANAGFPNIVSHVAPYGAWIEPRFVLLEWSRELYSLPRMPEGLTDFAFAFDDWFDYEEDPEEWRRLNDYDQDEKAFPPAPFRFEFQVTPAQLLGV